MAHKGHTANKKETLQTGKKHCKQKTNAAKKQNKMYTANKKEHIMRVHLAKGTGYLSSISFHFSKSVQFSSIK